MRLLGAYCLVKLDAPPTRHRSGLVLPEKHAPEAQTGVIVKRGEGLYFERFVMDERGQITRTYEKRHLLEEVKEGDRVILPPWAGYELDIDGERYLLVREDDLLAVIVEDTASTTP